MSNSEDFGLTRYRGTERFYNPPAVRRYHESQKKHQPSPRRQLWKSLKYESRLDSSDAEARTDSEESTLSRPNSVSLPSSSSSSSSRDAASSNLDRIIESVTPYVKAQTFPEARMRGWSPEEAFYYLEDLWEAFREWSVYGVGVPLLLNGCDLVKQYYVPYLSGIQLYVNPQRLSDVGSGNWEAERWTNGVVVNRGQSRHNLMNLNAQMLYGLSLRDSHPFSPSSNSPGKPIYEYLETEPPYVRKPLYDQGSMCTEAVIYCLLVGSLLHGTQYTEYLLAQLYKVLRHLFLRSIIYRCILQAKISQGRMLLPVPGRATL
ncbi:uncharacterized protein LOC133789514 isoform X2 [Humulus lupulus]|uniref:uncharacterized protein LOC133789514 isoform X2 n=1 Tax=Humulus lupulus TaxID=3486 RepID=UPI002B415027|nr:uncharacterized protein LOC133789514 isoform X2 [Humulus lupulus]